MPTYSLYASPLYQQRYAPHPVLYYDRVWNDYHMETHTHPQVEIMYVVEGKCAVYSGWEAAETKHEMGSGDYILLDTDVPHRLAVEKDVPCRMKNIEFSFTAAQSAQMSMAQLYQSSEDLQRLLRKRAPVVLGHDRQGDLLRAFDSLLTFYLYSLEKPHAKALSDHAFAMLLLTLAYLQGQAGASGAAAHLRKAQGYIQAHCSERMTIREIADAANIHPVYLQRLFHANLGRTVTEYINHQRVERAAYLLRHTQRPITAIAAETGFGSRQQFYRCFLAEKGLSPREYRSDHANT